VTLQTAAQAPEVAAMMRRASVVPLRATVRPDSAVLTSIAGAPAERVAPMARAVVAVQSAPAVRATGHGAAAMSAGFRGRRRR
jgi:hypothetical protein